MSDVTRNSTVSTPNGVEDVIRVNGSQVPAVCAERSNVLEGVIGLVEGCHPSAMGKAYWSMANSFAYRAGSDWKVFLLTEEEAYLVRGASNMAVANWAFSYAPSYGAPESKYTYVPTAEAVAEAAFAPRAPQSQRYAAELQSAVQSAFGGSESLLRGAQLYAKKVEERMLHSSREKHIEELTRMVRTSLYTETGYPNFSDYQVLSILRTIDVKVWGVEYFFYASPEEAKEAADLSRKVVVRELRLESSDEEGRKKAAKKLRKAQESLNVYNRMHQNSIMVQRLEDPTKLSTLGDFMVRAARERTHLGEYTAAVTLLREYRPEFEKALVDFTTYVESKAGYGSAQDEYRNSVANQLIREVLEELSRDSE